MMYGIEDKKVEQRDWYPISGFTLEQVKDFSFIAVVVIGTIDVVTTSSCSTSGIIVIIGTGSAGKRLEGWYERMLGVQLQSMEGIDHIGISLTLFSLLRQICTGSISSSIFRVSWERHTLKRGESNTLYLCMGCNGSTRRIDKCNGSKVVPIKAFRRCINVQCR